MIDNTQPEALRLADTLDLAPENGIEPQTTEEAAAELRRLHAECEALRDGARAMRSARWYMLNKDGMATLCTSKKDAEKEARAMDMAWPHMGPHRAVQLVEASFDAADMATASADGFRSAAAEVAKLKGQRMVLCSLLGECLPVIDALMQIPGDDDSDAHLNGLMARVGDALVAIAEDQVKGGES